LVNTLEVEWAKLPDNSKKQNGLIVLFVNDCVRGRALRRSGCVLEPPNGVAGIVIRKIGPKTRMRWENWQSHPEKPG